MKHAKTAAQAGTFAEVFLHSCGGKIKMVDRFRNGKLRHLAVCQKCGAEARKVRDLCRR